MSRVPPSILNWDVSTSLLPIWRRNLLRFLERMKLLLNLVHSLGSSPRRSRMCLTLLLARSSARSTWPNRMSIRCRQERSRLLRFFVRRRNSPSRKPNKSSLVFLCCLLFVVPFHRRIVVYRANKTNPIQELVPSLSEVYRNRLT